MADGMDLCQTYVVHTIYVIIFMNKMTMTITITITTSFILITNGQYGKCRLLKRHDHKYKITSYTHLHQFISKPFYAHHFVQKPAGRKN